MSHCLRSSASNRSAWPGEPHRWALERACGIAAVGLGFGSRVESCVGGEQSSVWRTGVELEMEDVKAGARNERSSRQFVITSKCFKTS